MTINNIGQLFNEKLTDINKRIPTTQNVGNKFESLLEQVQLKSPDAITKSKETSNNSLESSDTISLLKNMMATNSYLSTTNSLFPSDTNSAGMFPTSSFNNSINSLQQNLLLKTLEKNNNEE